MSESRPIELDMDNCRGRYALVAARFNASIVDRLLESALATLERHGVGAESVTVLRVPGAFELPQAARRLADSARFDAVIALGAVVRGGTPHFEYVSAACARGLMDVSVAVECPVIFGVLTTDDQAQALERAGGAEGDKGKEAALAALEMVSTYRSVFQA